MGKAKATKIALLFIFIVIAGIFSVLEISKSNQTTQLKNCRNNTVQMIRISSTIFYQNGTIFSGSEYWNQGQIVLENDTLDFNQIQQLRIGLDIVNRSELVCEVMI